MSITDIGFCISLGIGIFVVVIVAIALVAFMIREGLFKIAHEDDTESCSHTFSDGSNAIIVDKETSNGLMCKCLKCSLKIWIPDEDTYKMISDRKTEE